MRKHFIIVGAQRSGTTYLYKMLEQHPDICLAKPVFPEPKYFLTNSKHELNINDYYSHFFEKDCSDCIVFGEKSTSYYEKEEAAAAIASIFPQAKILFLLRNPVDRALSNFFFTKQNGLETRKINEVFNREKPEPEFESHRYSVSPFDYLKRGEYSIFIDMYLGYFPEKQIKVFLFEELVKDPNVLAEICSFLAVNKSFIFNRSNVVINRSSKVDVIPKQVEYFLRKYYKNEVKKIESKLNRELACWK